MGVVAPGGHARAGRAGASGNPTAEAVAVAFQPAER